MYDIHAFTLALVVCHGIVFLINMWTNHKYLKISFSIQLLSFLKPIIPFMIMVFVYYNFLAETNSYLLFLIFLIIQFTYLYLLKNPGMYIVINLIKGYIKNK
jgi:amino acid transporter